MQNIFLSGANYKGKCWKNFHKNWWMYCLHWKLDCWQQSKGHQSKIWNRFLWFHHLSQEHKIFVWKICENRYHGFTFNVLHAKRPCWTLFCFNSIETRTQWQSNVPTRYFNFLTWKLTNFLWHFKRFNHTPITFGYPVLGIWVKIKILTCFFY